MTCIVGLVAGGKVFMGGDSAGVDGYNLILQANPKVFVNDGYLVGFTSSFRMGQLLQYALKPPHPEAKADLLRFMATEFVDAVRACLKAGGFASKDNEAESGGCFLVGYRGRLFRFEDGYQVCESAYGFDAVGCGESYAVGSLHATPKLEPRKRVTLALEIAERCSAGVRAPFHVMGLPRKSTD